MINEQNQGISRRSFIKRSTVAAIAATNLLMFTGLVNAGEESPSPKKCKVMIDVGTTDWSVDKGIGNVIHKINDCWCDDNTLGNGQIQCGVWYEFDKDANPVLVKPVFVTCGDGGHTKTQTQMCWPMPPIPDEIA